MARKPTLGEIAQADHGILMSKAYTHMLMVTIQHPSYKSGIF